MTKRYKIMISQVRNPKATVSDLKLKVGDQVYYRVFYVSPRLKGYASLLPRNLAGEIVKVISNSVVLIRSSETGRTLSRFVGDISRLKVAKTYGNLYSSSSNAIGDKVKDLERKEEINEGKLNATETNWRRKHPLMRE